MSRRALFAFIVCGLIVIAVQPTSAAVATPNLTGSWQFVLTPIAPTPPVVPIPGLATFTADGSVIETDGSEFVPTPPSTVARLRAGTPGHGIWQPAPVPGTLYVQYISLVLQVNGSLFARHITTMFLTTNTTGDQFTGTYTTDQVIGTVTRVLSSGTVNGQLIPHPALP